MPENSVEADSKVVRKLRRERGWTQEDLAKKSGYDVRTISSIENGKLVQITTIAAIAEALNVEPKELIATDFGGDVGDSVSSLQGVTIAVTTHSVQITIDDDFDRFDRAKKQRVAAALSALLGEDQLDLNYAAGSVVVTVRGLTEEQAAYLESKLGNGKLAGFDVVGVQTIVLDNLLKGSESWSDAEDFILTGESLDDEDSTILESHATTSTPLPYESHEERPIHELDPKRLAATGSGSPLPASLAARLQSFNPATFKIGFDSTCDYIYGAAISAGGMGAVYEARQTRSNRLVALKIMKGGDASQSIRDKFVSEALIMSDLPHPNIPPVYDIGLTTSGEPFYATKYTKGDEWQGQINELSEAENLSILVQVAHAIDFAHSEGILHRDLKPGNVMLCGYGEVLLMDWGLATRHDSESRIEPAGTPIYMPPETAQQYLDYAKGRVQGQEQTEAAGDRKSVGTHSDIYQLGALLFQIVSRRAPHRGKSTFECLRNAANNRIVSVSQSSKLLEIAYKAMATDPADRYPSASDFIKAIKAYRATDAAEVVSRHSRHDLELAISDPNATGVTKYQSYFHYAKACAGFQHAATLSQDDSRYDALAGEAGDRFAEAAYNRGDYGQARWLLESGIANDRALLQKTVAAQRREPWWRKWLCGCD